MVENYTISSGGAGKDFLLSLCIPTYNRPQDFKRVIDGLLPQITNEVEIVIRDDGPDNSTKEIFERAVSGKGINYQYFKGGKIGLDAANLFLLEKARGEFVWWFSDDDELLPGGIEAATELIKANPDLNLIWANFYFGSREVVAVDRSDGFFKNGSYALEELGTNIGLLSTYIIRREKGLLGLGIAKKHVVGFSFASTCVVLFILSEPGKFYFLRGPYILCHPTTTQEFKEKLVKDGKIRNEAFNVYGVDFYNIIGEFKGKFAKKAIRKILSVNFAALWRGMVVAWIGGWDTPIGKRWKMLKLYWSFPEIWLAMPIFLMPLFVNRFLYRIYKVFFNERKWVLGRSAGSKNK